MSFSKSPITLRFKMSGNWNRLLLTRLELLSPEAVPGSSSVYCWRRSNLVLSPYLLELPWPVSDLAISSAAWGSAVA